MGSWHIKVKYADEKEKLSLRINRTALALGIIYDFPQLAIANTEQLRNNLML